MIAWLAVVLGINSSCYTGNFNWLHLVKLLPALLMLLIPNTTVDHAILYTNMIDQIISIFISSLLVSMVA